MNSKKRNTLIVFSSLLILLSGCWHSSSWTEEERDEFQSNCESQIYFDADPICFVGFEFDELNSVRIVESEGLKIIDTLFVQFEPNQIKPEKEKLKIWGSTNTQFNVNHSYAFYLGDDAPYVLENMEMIMWAQYTMGGEGWGCVMGNFTIDSIQFEHEGNIRIKKRGFKYGWEQ